MDKQAIIGRLSVPAINTQCYFFRPSVNDDRVRRQNRRSKDIWQRERNYKNFCSMWYSSGRFFMPFGIAISSVLDLTILIARILWGRLHRVFNAVGDFIVHKMVFSYQKRYLILYILGATFFSVFITRFTPPVSSCGTLCTKCISPTAADFAKLVHLFHNSLRGMAPWDLVRLNAAATQRYLYS